MDSMMDLFRIRFLVFPSGAEIVREFDSSTTTFHTIKLKLYESWPTGTLI